MCVRARARACVCVCVCVSECVCKTDCTLSGQISTLNDDDFHVTDQTVVERRRTNTFVLSSAEVALKLSLCQRFFKSSVESVYPELEGDFVIYPTFYNDTKNSDWR